MQGRSDRPRHQAKRAVGPRPPEARLLRDQPAAAVIASSAVDRCRGRRTRARGEFASEVDRGGVKRPLSRAALPAHKELADVVLWCPRHAKPSASSSSSSSSTRRSSASATPAGDGASLMSSSRNPQRGHRTSASRVVIAVEHHGHVQDRSGSQSNGDHDGDVFTRAAGGGGAPIGMSQWRGARAVRAVSARLPTVRNYPGNPADHRTFRRPPSGVPLSRYW